MTSTSIQFVHSVYTYVQVSTCVKTDDVDFCCIKALILGQLQLQYFTVLHCI